MPLLVFVFSSWGMARTYRTFERSVVNQYYVSRVEAVNFGAGEREGATA